LTVKLGSRDILWVTDTPNRMVRAYDVNVSTWTDIVEIPTLSFSVSHTPVDVAVDTRRNLVYTVGSWAGSRLLSKYDVTAGVETTIDLGVGGIGVAVDEINGYVYMTRGTSSAGDDIQVWDCSTSPFTLLQDTPRIGNPAGIAIANVSYNPLNLAKNDVVQGYGVYIGQTFTYQITCDNYGNTSDITGVTMVDNLPVELDFVSETVGGFPGTGTYDFATHTVTWDIGTIPTGQAGPLVELVVRTNQNAIPNTTIYNYCTIESDQTPPTTVIGDDPDNPDPDPGTPIISLAKVMILPDTWYTSWGTPHNGRIRCWIGEIEGYDVSQINVSSLLLNGTVSPWSTTRYRIIPNWPGFTGSVLEVAFDRYQSYLSLGSVFPGQQCPVTISGQLNDGTSFSGEDMNPDYALSLANAKKILLQA